MHLRLLAHFVTRHTHTNIVVIFTHASLASSLARFHKISHEKKKAPHTQSACTGMRRWGASRVAPRPGARGVGGAAAGRARCVCVCVRAPRGAAAAAGWGAVAAASGSPRLLPPPTPRTYPCAYKPTGPMYSTKGVFFCRIAQYEYVRVLTYCETKHICEFTRGNGRDVEIAGA